MKILMLKRSITLVIAMLLIVSSLFAQNANRNGCFIEIQGGTAIGKLLEYDPEARYSTSRLKGGCVTSLDFGYRFATSKQFGVDTKLGLWANLADFKYTYQFRLLPGIRWTSKDFGSNRSIYLALNIGIGLTPASKNWRGEHEETGINVPVELSAGINISTHLYGGLFFSYSILASGECCDFLKFNNYADDEREVIYLFRKSYPSLSIRLGYRF